jgi:hypothetical protein
VDGGSRRWGPPGLKASEVVALPVASRRRATVGIHALTLGFICQSHSSTQRHNGRHREGSQPKRGVPAVALRDPTSPASIGSASP